MAVNISYMGTKKELAPAVADVIRQCQPGVMLDAFAGMCTVGEEVAPKRQVWSNDAQVFASEVGRALFTSNDEPLGALQAADLHFDSFEKHRDRLSKRCALSLVAEEALFQSQTFSVFSKRKTKLSKMLGMETATLSRRHGSLFTKLYSDSYFGIHQAIEADAILQSIFSAHAKGILREDHKRWLTIGLGRSLMKLANSTGHFAQFLKPKAATYQRHLRQRRRSLWTEWLFSAGELQAAGTSDWRKRNRSFNEDSLSLVPRLARSRVRPAVIYADPPYTDDQYSRYYHLLETLFLYDYPAVSGAGLYRPNRFQTSFSIKSKAISAFTQFVSGVAKTGADLVLSYPSNGLLQEAGADPINILQTNFTKVECCYSLPHNHSTFGASKGEAQSGVTELIYLATL